MQSAFEFDVCYLCAILYIIPFVHEYNLSHLLNPAKWVNVVLNDYKPEVRKERKALINID